MNLLTSLLGDSTVIGLFQMIIAKLWKDSDGTNGKPDLPNFLIPYVTFVLAIFGYTMSPAVANAAAAIDVPVTAGVFGAALAQTITVTGTHSMFKNAVIPALKTTLAFILAQLQKAIVK